MSSRRSLQASAAAQQAQQLALQQEARNQTSLAYRRTAIRDRTTKNRTCTRTTETSTLGERWVKVSTAPRGGAIPLEQVPEWLKTALNEGGTIPEQNKALLSNTFPNLTDGSYIKLSADEIWMPYNPAGDGAVNCDVDGYLMKRVLPTRPPVEYSMLTNGSLECSKVAGNVIVNDLRHLTPLQRQEQLKDPLSIDNTCGPPITWKGFGHELAEYADFVVYFSPSKTAAQKLTMPYNVPKAFVVLKRIYQRFALAHKLPWWGEDYMYLTLVCSNVQGSFNGLHDLACAVAWDQLEGNKFRTMVLSSMPNPITLYLNKGYTPLTNLPTNHARAPLSHVSRSSSPTRSFAPSSRSSSPTRSFAPSSRSSPTQHFAPSSRSSSPTRALRQSPSRLDRILQRVRSRSPSREANRP